MESLPTGICRWPCQIAIGKAFADDNLSFAVGKGGRSGSARFSSHHQFVLKM
jgi:hypothetical protein